jgi:signal transduction histidine kinase/ligand-binding sensor domain-containing protein/DNA-binding response OmpR family regulator
VNDIYQDSFGFIWMTTEYGLNRFDGQKFTTFRHSNQDPNTVGDNYIHVVFEDAEKHLWIGCLTGLMQYRHDTDTFERIPLLRNNKRVAANVTCIRESSNGKLWIATSGQGMFVMANSDTEAHSIEEEYPKANPAYLSSLLVDKKNKVWVGTDGSGLVMIDYEAHRAQVIDDSAIKGEHIQALCMTDDGTLFLGTQNNGLVRYNAASNKMERVPYSGTNPSNNVFCLANVEGKLLVGTDGQGIKVYNPSTKTMEDYVNAHAPLNLTHGKVHALMYDRESNLWVGLFQKGAVRIPNRANVFTYYGPRTALENPIGDACIMAVCRSKNGHLWVGADNDGLYELDANGNRVRHYVGRSTPNAPATVLSIFEDSENNLWIGSFSQGISRLNPATGQFSLLADSLKNAIVYSMAEGKGKKLYISIFGNGFMEYDLLSKRAEIFHSSKSERDDQTRNELPNDWVNAVYCDRDGLVWLGHYKGVSCFNPENESFLTINHRNSLTVGCVGYAFTEDTYGNIWAATSDGLYRYNKKTGQTTHFSEADGLADDVVCGLAHDDEGNIWATTYNGMSKYEAKTNRFINYYAGDGLQGNDFTHGACFNDAKGYVYFGGPGGVTAFQPKQVKQDATPLHVYVTDFYVHNQPVYMNTLSGGKPIVEAPVPEAKQFRLAYNDHTFAIAVSTMTFDHPEQITYQYRMDELGDDWSMTEAGVNRVTFHNLSPGNYTFRVRAVDHGKESEETVIPIHISSPWYTSWWAILIYCALALLLLWVVVMNIIQRVRNQRNQLKAAHVEQLSEAKMQFFINISHEIRTPMTLIMSPVEKLLKQATTSDVHQTYLMIYRNAQRILNLINQLLDIGKLDKGQMRMKFRETDLVLFIQDVMQPFEYLAQRKNIRFAFSHVSAHLKAWVDGNNFDKILVNILSNAFKFTPDGGEIVIRLQSGHDESREDALSDYIEISVTDSGVGIEKEQLEKIFERFYQADNELGAGQFGTGVGLHLTHTLVKMHHGEIHAENRENGTGSRFVIRIPRGHDHLDPSEIEQGTTEAQTSAPANAENQLAESLATEAVVPATEEPTKPDATPAEMSARQGHMHHLLVVEDEEDIRLYLQQELSDGYIVDVAANGKEAYDLILKTPVDLVISDVMMPVMDGNTLCRKIKKHPQTNHIPVILLTAKAQANDRVEGLENGADSFIVKPFNVDVLRSTIANLIDSRRVLRNKFSGAQEQEDKVQPVKVRPGDDKFMERLMAVVNAHLADSDFNVEVLSSELGLSRVHIHRKLKEITNLSTANFIKQVRLQQAAKLLTEDDKLNVSEVAYAVGYGSLSSFSVAFREMYGVSPKEYMHQDTEKKE